jgi:hypothetical protein
MSMELVLGSAVFYLVCLEIGVDTESGWEMRDFPTNF